LNSGGVSSLSSGGDTLLGGVGNDNIDGGASNDSIDGGVGNDTINAGGGDDTVFGGDGDDVIRVGNSATSAGDFADGSAGNDELGNSTIIGGEDGDGSEVDFISGFDANDGITVTFDGTEQGTHTDNSDSDSGTFSQIEGVRGSNQIDSINAAADNSSRLFISGYAGADTIIGGDDAITGGLGADSLSGGAGDDTLTGDEDNDTIDGGAGNDYVMGDRR
jgi:Ca2+-binding RTX toxin-like protein